MDRYTKTILTVIAIALVSLAVKDVDLFPIAEAQQGWEIDNELAMMNGSMQALPASAGMAYICRSYLVPMQTSFGDHGYVVVDFYTAAQCKGSLVGSGYLFSEGAFSQASMFAWQFSENQLLAHYNLASRAADTGQRVRYVRCSTTKTYCLKWISFRGDPNDVLAEPL